LYVWKFAGWQLMTLRPALATETLQLYISNLRAAGVAGAAALHVAWSFIPPLAIAGYFSWRIGRPQIRDVRHISGFRLLRSRDARGAAARALGREIRSEGKGILLAPGICLSLSREVRGMLLAGGAGSGKTTILLPIMSAARKRGDRTIIFDVKGDFTSALDATDGGLVLVAPWDARSAVWDIAADIRTRADARLAAQLIIPDGGGDPMFANAARAIFAGTLIHLGTSRPGKWGFGDLAKLLGDACTLREILPVVVPEAQATIDAFESKTGQSVMINLGAYLSPIYDLARAWPTPGSRSVSFRRFVKDCYKGPRTIILQGSGEHRMLQRFVAATAIGLLSSTVASPSLSESRKRRIWLFLDEFPQLGRVPQVRELIEVGRSKGIRVVIGVQDIAQIRNVYDQDTLEILMTSLATKIIANTNAGATNQYFSSMFGDTISERLVVTATADGGCSRNWQRLSERVLSEHVISAELTATSAGATAVLACAGMPDLYRLFWPRQAFPVRRRASVPAKWTTMAGDAVSVSTTGGTEAVPVPEPKLSPQIQKTKVEVAEVVEIVSPEPPVPMQCVQVQEQQLVEPATEWDMSKITADTVDGLTETVITAADGGISTAVEAIDSLLDTVVGSPEITTIPNAPPISEVGRRRKPRRRISININEQEL
jgi:hypothetical protein